MKRLILASLAVFAIAGTGTSALISWPIGKADSIKAFAGCRVRMAWKRGPWCTERYQPTQGLPEKVMAFDTDIGQERVLDDGGDHGNFIRISRSGRWVFWTDLTAKISYVRDFDGNQPKKVFLSKVNVSYFYVVACWTDPVTKKEYVFAEEQGATGLYKIPLNDDGSADRPNASKVTINASAPSIDETVSASADGLKMGFAYPWPTTYILDVPSGRLDLRHGSAQFGCQANLAPDNSYRFFHCDDNHAGVYMFGPQMQNTFTWVDLSTGLPGNSRNPTDFCAPRWTNNVEFFSNTFPCLETYKDGDPSGCGPVIDVWSLDSAGVVTRVRQDCLQNWVLGKFSADYKSVASYIPLAMDIRYYQSGGDVWMANGVTTGTNPATGVIARRSTPRSRLNSVGGIFTVTCEKDAPVSVRISDAQGRSICRREGRGMAQVDSRNVKPGVYLVSAVANGEVVSSSMTTIR